MIPNARLETIDDSYVYVAEDQPERMIRLVDELMALPARSGSALAAAAG